MSLIIKTHISTPDLLLPAINQENNSYSGRHITLFGWLNMQAKSDSFCKYFGQNSMSFPVGFLEKY